MPLPITVAPHRFRFDENCGGDDCNEEVLCWVLDKGGRGVRVLSIAMAGRGVVVVDIAMEGVQSAVNETTDEDKK